MLRWTYGGLVLTCAHTPAGCIEQLRENLGALEIIDRLTPAVMARLDRISRPVAE
ncbi:MAG: hypothetical protein PHE83_00225 [Opitutaceae bacterium]|nr:hypothetical protein [Opitutaceae bacterium]